MALNPEKRELFIVDLLVRIHVIIEMIWWTGLAPWHFEFPFPGSLIFTFLDRRANILEWRRAKEREVLGATFEVSPHNPAGGPRP